MPAIASMTNWMCSFKSTPNSSAPRTMSSRLTNTENSLKRIHQRAPVILGSRQEVERVERYHAEYDRGEDKPYSSPLFGERSLFRNG